MVNGHSIIDYQYEPLKVNLSQQKKNYHNTSTVLLSLKKSPQSLTLLPRKGREKKQEKCLQEKHENQSDKKIKRTIRSCEKFIGFLSPCHFTLPCCYLLVPVKCQESSQMTLNTLSQNDTNGRRWGKEQEKKENNKARKKVDIHM